MGIEFKNGCYFYSALEGVVPCFLTSVVAFKMSANCLITVPLYYCPILLLLRISSVFYMLLYSLSGG